VSAESRCPTCGTWLPLSMRVKVERGPQRVRIRLNGGGTTMPARTDFPLAA